MYQLANLYVVLQYVGFNKAVKNKFVSELKITVFLKVLYIVLTTLRNVKC